MEENEQATLLYFVMEVQTKCKLFHFSLHYPYQ